MRTLLFAALLVVGCTAATEPTRQAGATVILVRHAETEGTDTDRDLSAAGRMRAEALAYHLRDEKATRVMTTGYRRSLNTAAVVASLLSVPMETYDPRDLGAVAETIRQRSQSVIVVGHSNTTPELVRLLGGDPGAAMTEAEYDRLYRVELPGGRTAMERYPASR